jgi:Zn-dependent protease
MAWTWVFVAALIALTFANSRIGSWPQKVVTALGAAAILFVAVLVHELAHGWAARRVGIGVRQYTFTFFGGETQFTVQPPTAGKSALIAAAGPVSNLFLGGVAWGALQAIIRQLTADDTLGRMAETSISWLASGVNILYLAGVLNLMVGAFNLIPALPLDGGALLQDLVWAITKRQEKGTIVAGWSGVVLGCAMVAWGMFSMERGMAAIVWAILIGMSVAQGGWASVRRGRATLRASVKTVAEFLEPAVAAPTGTPLRNVAADLAAGTWIVVTDNGQSVGYVDPDAARRVSSDASVDTPLSAVMIALPRGAAVPAGLAGVDLVRAVGPYAAAVRLLPVSDAGRLVGVIPVAAVVAGL